MAGNYNISSVLLFILLLDRDEDFYNFLLIIVGFY